MGPAYGDRARRYAGAVTAHPSPEPVVRLALTRHGQTDWNADGRFQGSSDVPLNDIGRGQAAESAARFDRADWDAVVTSPLSRAAETGRIIAEGLGIPFRGTYDDLVERHYGEAEGVKESEARERWLDGEFPGLESRESVAIRGRRAIEAIASDLPGQRVVVVAHGTLIREVLRTLTDADIPPILNAATSVLEQVGTDDGWRVLTVNDRPLSGR